MEHLSSTGRQTEVADEKTFDGRATLTRFLGSEPDARGRVYRVAFEPGARTHWHRHTDLQILYVVEGRCLVQTWGGPVQVAEAGDVVRFAGGEKHWHGATSDGPMTHLAVNLGDRTEWMEAVEVGGEVP